MSALRRPVLHLDVSSPQGTEMHLDLSEQQEPLLLLGFYTLRTYVCAVQKFINYDYL
jgi:hypothetical protein